MKKRALYVILIAPLMLLTPGLDAQDAVATAGGEAEGSGGSVSYSVGQVVFSTMQSETGTLLQGVQQPYEILTLIDKEPLITVEISAYPNPTDGFVILKVESELLDDLHYQVFDMAGKMMAGDRITWNRTEIDMSRLDPSSYLLRVYRNNRDIKVFMIIRN